MLSKVCKKGEVLTLNNTVKIQNSRRVTKSRPICEVLKFDLWSLLTFKRNWGPEQFPINDNITVVIQSVSATFFILLINNMA